MTNADARAFALGQLIGWPTFDPRALLVDYLPYHELCSALAPASAQPLALPPYQAVVFEVLKDGSALAAYNGRFTPEQLAQNVSLPVLWLRPRVDAQTAGHH